MVQRVEVVGSVADQVRHSNVLHGLHQAQDSVALALVQDYEVLALVQDYEALA